MKVIGAGLPRTGTLTQKIALEMLGFGPCYHMVNVLSDLSLVQQWSIAFEGGANWDKVFAGHESTVDWPGSFFYRELIDVYPDAKVLLSVRPADQWAKSMTNTIWDVVYGDSIVHDLSQARTRIDEGWDDYMSLITAMWEKSGLLPSNVAGDPGPGRAGRGIRQVQRRGSGGQFQPTGSLCGAYADGWEPLCEFLEVPVPRHRCPG